MQFATDLLALFLLHQQQLAGHQPQLGLHLPRLLQQLAGVALAFPKGFLRQSALDDFLFQPPIGGRQFQGALAQRAVRLIQLGVCLQRAAMSFLDRSDSLGKKNPRPPDHPSRVRGE